MKLSASQKHILNTMPGSRMLSDYWITVAGDPDMAYQMAYEYLSDPDRK